MTARRPPRSLLDLRRLVDAALATAGLPDFGARLLVGVSGGADSMALLHAAIPRVATAAARELLVVHVHHGVRGAAADADADFVAAAAHALGLAVELRRLEASPAGAAPPSESSLRAARFAAFEEVARGAAIPRHALLLGHQRDDLAETLLLRAARGASPEALAGPLPASRRRSGLLVLRPFLGVRAAALRDILRAEGIAWREDATNASPRHARNRARHVLLPALERDVAEGAVEHLAALAEQLRDDRLYWDDRIAEVLHAEPHAPHAVRLEALRRLPRALRLRVLARLLGDADCRPPGGREASPHDDVTRRVVAALDAFVGEEGRRSPDDAAVPARLDLPGRRQACREGWWLRFVPRGARPAPLDMPQALTLAEPLVLRPGLAVERPVARLASEGSAPTLLRVAVVAALQPGDGGAALPRATWRVVAEGGATALEVRVVPGREADPRLRAWREGDRLATPRGGSAGEALRRAGVPAAWRPFAPVVEVVGGGVILVEPEAAPPPPPA